MKEIEFWFSIGSTYAYLSVTRLPQVARETGAIVFLAAFQRAQHHARDGQCSLPPQQAGQGRLHVA